MKIIDDNYTINQSKEASSNNNYDDCSFRNGKFVLYNSDDLNKKRKLRESPMDDRLTYIDEPAHEEGEHGTREEFENDGVGPEINSFEESIMRLGEVTEAHVILEHLRLITRGWRNLTTE